MLANLENRGQRNGKGHFSFRFQGRTTPKNVQTTVQLCSFHILAKMLKILQVRLQQYTNSEFPDVYINWV